MHAPAGARRSSPLPTTAGEARPPRAALVLAVAVATVVSLLAGASPALATGDGDWECAPRAGFTFDDVKYDRRCLSPYDSVRTNAPIYHLRVPVDGLWACEEVAGMTYDETTASPPDTSTFCPPPAMSPVGGRGRSYHLKTPVDGLWACTRPAGFTSSEASTSWRCGTSTAPIYRLWDVRPRTLTAAPATVTLEPPAVGSTKISWSSPDDVRIFVSKGGGPESLFATGRGTTLPAQVETPQTYVYRMYAGTTSTSHVLASLTVQGLVRPLSSTSPSLARRIDGTIDVFARTADGMAAMSTLSPTARLVTPWTSLGRAVRGAPSGVWTPGRTPSGVWSPDRTLYVFAVGTDGHVIRRRYTAAGGWGAWQDMPGGEIARSATVGVARAGMLLTLTITGAAREPVVTTFMSFDAFESAVTWEHLDGRIIGAPAPTWSEDGSTLDLVAVGLDYSIYQRRWDGTRAVWLPWQREPGNGGAGSATVGLAHRPDRRDLFLRGANGSSYVEVLKADGSLDTRWKTLELATLGAPTGSWNLDGTRLDVVAVGTNSRIYRRRYVNGVWSAWADTQVASATVGLAPRSDGGNLLIRGNDGAACSQGFTNPWLLGGTWSPMTQRVLDAPTGSWSPDDSTLDVAAVDPNGAVIRRQYVRGKPASAWISVPGAPRATGSASVASFSGGMTIAVRGVDGNGWVVTLTRSGSVLVDWRRLGGPLRGAPAISWSPNGKLLDLAAVGTDSRIYRREYAWDTGWSPWAEAAGDTISGAPTVGVADNADGVTITARDEAGAMLARTFPRSGSPAGAWQNLGGSVLGAPTPAWRPGGNTLDVVAVGADYRPWRRQLVRGQPWGAWTALTGGGSLAPYYGLPGVLPATAPPALDLAGDPAAAVPTDGSVAGRGSPGQPPTDATVDVPVEVSGE